MNKEKTMHRYCNRTLNRGKRCVIGPIEKMLLRCAGKNDGRRGLVKMNEKGVWTSAFVQGEINACVERQERVFGMAQLFLDEKYSNTEVLCAQIFQMEREKEEHLSRIPKVPESEKLLVRRRGEERLTDEQVSARRLREYERQILPMQQQIADIKNTISDAYKEFVKTRSQIEETENASQIICDRLMSHTRQRIDVYWRAAQSKIKETMGMPVIYQGLAIPNAAATYRSLHEEQTQKAERLLKKYHAWIKEAA